MGILDHSRVLHPIREGADPCTRHMAQPNDHIIAKLSAFIACILAIILILIFSGCAGNPQPTRPKGVPYPTTLGPHLPAGVYGINQTRCFGGGIGGCSLGGKAVGGPVGQ